MQHKEVEGNKEAASTVVEPRQVNRSRTSGIGRRTPRWFVALALIGWLTIFCLLIYFLWLYVRPSTPTEKSDFVQAVVVLISGAVFLVGLSFIARYLQIPYFSVGAMTFLVAVAVLWGLIQPTTVDQNIGFFQTVGGIVGGSALLFGLYFTAQTLKVNREGQITDRYTRAIDQLGSDELEIRLGGIYALERIARDSERDHWPIIEVLTAYVRQHARRRFKKEATEDVSLAERDTPEPDIQAILSVIWRRSEDHTNRVVEPGPIDLRGSNLRGANLRGAILMACDLTRADLREADLREAIFYLTILDGARLEHTKIQGTDLRMSKELKGVQIRRADGDKKTILPKEISPPAKWGEQSS